jgi:L-alanine-DL-glutamate epimerase-like enolase superfamily enzyme
MKITSIDTSILTIPLPKPMSLQYPHHKLVVAQVMTDEGITGLGYTLTFGGGNAEPVLVHLDTRLKPLLVGENPLLVERLWERMYRSDMGKKHGIAAYALSALDIALWDIVGKAAGLPLYKLWGGVTETIDAYGSGGFSRYSEADLIAEARWFAELGCKYYKMKIHHPDLSENRNRVAAVHRELGSQMRLMVDVNQRLGVVANIRQAALLEEFDLLWYEEPVPADDVASCAEVAQAIRIPIATGENAYTRFEFRDLIERRAARYLMPDVGHANGFSETLKIGHLAAAHQIAVSPHLAHELSLHVVGALANGFLVEFMNWIPQDLFEDAPQCSKGCFKVPERPGHGLVLARGALEKYRSR